ncbi:hypothetical protein Landi51_06817 [Colletotrichum acutatum]
MSVEDSSPCSPRVSATTRPRKIWTPEEDVTLKTLVSRYGDARGPQGHWKDIAAALQDRTAKDCRKRWFHSLDPSIKKGRWTAQEDQILLSAYARMGPAWHDIGMLDLPNIRVASIIEDIEKAYVYSNNSLKVICRNEQWRCYDIRYSRTLLNLAARSS